MNIVALNGRLVKDVEVKVTKNGKKYCDFTVAVNKYKDGANFINVQSWNATADFLGKYAKKGNMVVVEGSLEVQNYTNKDGQNVYKTFVLSNRVDLVAQKNEAQQDTFGDTQEHTSDLTSLDKVDGLDLGGELDLGLDPFDSSEDLPF